MPGYLVVFLQGSQQTHPEAVDYLLVRHLEGNPGVPFGQHATPGQ